MMTENTTTTTTTPPLEGAPGLSLPSAVGLLPPLLPPRLHLPPPLSIPAVHHHHHHHHDLSIPSVGNEEQHQHQRPLRREGEDTTSFPFLLDIPDVAPPSPAHSPDGLPPLPRGRRLEPRSQRRWRTTNHSRLRSSHTTTDAATTTNTNPRHQDSILPGYASLMRTSRAAGLLPRQSPRSRSVREASILLLDSMEEEQTMLTSAASAAASASAEAEEELETTVTMTPVTVGTGSADSVPAGSSVLVNARLPPQPRLSLPPAPSTPVRAGATTTAAVGNPPRTPPSSPPKFRLQKRPRRHDDPIITNAANDDVDDDMGWYYNTNPMATLTGMIFATEAAGAGTSTQGLARSFTSRNRMTMMASLHNTANATTTTTTRSNRARGGGVQGRRRPPFTATIPQSVYLPTVL